MPQLKKLTIENFRQFDHLEIDGLSKVNFFVGKNNCGKTSILEALYFLLGMSYPELLTNYVTPLFRNELIRNPKELLYYFHNLSLENKPSFQGEFDNSEGRRLKFKPISNIPNINDNRIINNLQDIDIIGIENEFSLNKDKNALYEYSSSITYKPLKNNINNPWDIKRDTVYQENLSVYRIVHNDQVTYSCYSNILKENDKNEIQIILDLLKNIDSKIKKVTTLIDGIYFDYENIKNLVSLNVVGEGTKHLLDIIAQVISQTIVSKATSFICIDEIENGLHYSAYKLLLKGLLEFSEKHDIQLFITTHSLELLTHLKSLLSEENNTGKRDFIKIFNIANTTKRGYQTYGYSYEGLNSAINNKNEIRG
jgi:AAA15 family ATPase/GTPase